MMVTSASVRAAVVLAGLSMALHGCHWRRHRRHARAHAAARDPRQVWATSCDDPRFVTARPVVQIGPAPPAGHPFTAADGALRLVGAIQDHTVRAVVHGHPGTVDLGTHAQGAVATVATGHGVVAAWAVSPQGIAVVRVTADGVVHPFEGAGPDGVVIADGEAPALAFGGNRLMVFYLAPVPWGSALFATQFDPVTGRRVKLPVSIDGPDVGAHAVTWTDRRFALAWAAGDRLRFSTLSPEMLHTDPTVDLVTAGAPVDHVAMASGDHRVAVAWSDRGASEVLYSTAVDAITRTPTGVRQRLSIRFDPDATPSLAWDGAAFGVAWWEPVGGGNPRAYLALLDRDGARIGTQMRVLMPDEAGVRDTALTWTGRGYLLGYAREDGVVEARQTGPRGCDGEP